MDSRLAELQARYRRLPPRLVDALLVTLALGGSLLEIVLISGAPAGARAEGALAVAPLPIAVLLRRRFPMAAMLTGLLVLILLGFVDRAVIERSGVPWMTAFLLVFWFGFRNEGRRLWTGIALGCVLIVVSVLTDQYANTVTDIVFAIGIAIGGPLFVGQLLRHRTVLNRTLQDKVQRAEAGRRRAGELAAVAERARIAGELHDVVAHALGAMTVQAGAARRQAERGDAGAEHAREAFRAVEETGREALGELRRLLGVLRRDDDEIALAPQPRLAHVADLARRVRAAGLQVDLEVLGQVPAGLPAGVDLTGYRIVQEALAEARERAGAGRATVRVEYRPAEVLVEVGDDGRGEHGRALLGLRERVRVYGGDLESSAVRPAGHRLRARLPVGGAA